MGAGTQGFGALGSRARVKEMLVTDTPATAVDATLRALLADVLGLGEARAAALAADSGLFGELPEFVSMAVATVLTEMEDRLGILLDDDEVDGEIFETYGNLLRPVGHTSYLQSLLRISYAVFCLYQNTTRKPDPTSDPQP